MKYLILLFTFAFLVSCSKDETPETQKQNQQKVTQDEGDEQVELNLSPEEKFSAAILVDFLGDSEDEDLASFLETEVFKQGANFNGASVVEVTPSTWLVSLEKGGAVKNYFLQKYVDFKTNEYYFTFKETTLNISDVVSRPKSKSPAGE